jgi:DUF4097 and DUF4098 domain-containing protein YvlB
MRAVVIVSALSLVLAASAARASDKIFDHQVAAQPRGVVEVSNVSGSIKVTGWDRPQVSVHAETGEGVERVDVTSENGRTLVKVVLPGHSSRDAEADLVVQIPKDSELNVSAVSADVTTTGVTGMQRLSAVSGDVTAEIAAADVEAKTVSGELRLKGHDQPARLHLSSVSGDLRLEHGAGDLEAGTVSGTMVVSLDSARSVRAHTTSGDLRFEGKLTRGATFEASSVSGDLNVRASADGGYAYEASSFSGDISDCFDVKAERSGEYAPGHRLQGSRGEGAGHMHLKTMSGDIQLCDRN